KDLEKYGSIAGAGIGSKYWLRSQASWEPYIAYTDSKGEAGSKDPTESCGVRLMVRISKR
ncbi:MAG: hypothetical protein J6Z80_00040, partial [Clostridia bacterium]|nr:hypothetical protein [Clostridia bacterium]